MHVVVCAGALYVNAATGSHGAMVILAAMVITMRPVQLIKSNI